MNKITIKFKGLTVEVPTMTIVVLAIVVIIAHRLGLL
jgi:hypothetical protein